MLQRVGLKMVTSRGAEGSQVGVKSGKLEPLSRQNEATVSNIRSGAFDLTTGILTLEFHDGTAINVMGFATEFPETVVVLAPKVTRAQLVVAVKMVAMVAKAQ